MAGSSTGQVYFSQLTSVEQYPEVSWASSGLKSVNITVTDNDGGQASAQIFVNVLNQLPVSNFVVRDSGSAGSPIIDFRIEDGEVDVPYTFDLSLIHI